MAANAHLARNIRPLHEYRDDVWRCVRCGICRGVNPEKIMSQKYADNCPAGTRFKFESYFASGRHEIIRALTADPPEIEITDKLIHIAFTCTSCGNCQANCNPIKDLEPMNAAIALKQYLVEMGYGPLPAHNSLIQSVLNYDNPWMSPRSARDKWAKGLGIKDLGKEKAEVLMFVGCTGSYDHKFRPVVLATARALAQSNVDFGILGKAEKCCGSTIARVGDAKTFERVRRQNVEFLNTLGVKTMVTACAGCHSTFTHCYEDELDMEILHVVEFLDRLLEEGSLRFTREVEKVVSYHDPCHIGRYSGMYDQPRRILRSIPGVDFREMERIREWSWCCGAGGGVKTAYADFALWSARERLKETADTGATTLVSACPFCENNLADASLGSHIGIDVVDLMTLVGQALG